LTPTDQGRDWADVWVASDAVLTEGVAG
jgi:hypothetical protein